MAMWKRAVRLLGHYNGTAKAIPVRVSEHGALVRTTHEEESIRDGDAYFMIAYEDMTPNGAVRQFTITTPATGTIEWTPAISAESETKVEVKEDITITGAGSAIVPPNANRGSAKTCNAVFAWDKTVAITYTGGTTIMSRTVGDGRQGGEGTLAMQFLVLKPSTSYLVTVTSTVAGWVQRDMIIHEHDC